MEIKMWICIYIGKPDTLESKIKIRIGSILESLNTLESKMKIKMWIVIYIGNATIPYT